MPERPEWSWPHFRRASLHDSHLRNQVEIDSDLFERRTSRLRTLANGLCGMANRFRHRRNRGFTHLPFGVRTIGLTHKPTKELSGLLPPGFVFEQGSLSNHRGLCLNCRRYSPVRSPRWSDRSRVRRIGYHGAGPRPNLWRYLPGVPGSDLVILCQQETSVPSRRHASCLLILCSISTWSLFYTCTGVLSEAS